MTTPNLPLSVLDTIFVRVSIMGKTVANWRLCGIERISQILDYVKRSLGDACGMLKVDVRNASQGWNMTRWCPASSTTYRIGTALTVRAID